MTVQVLGTLEIGTATTPISDTVTATITFRDVPIDLTEDPGETRNVAEQKPEVAKRLEQALDQALSAGRNKREAPAAEPLLDAETRERLRHLGYVLE